MNQVLLDFIQIIQNSDVYKEIKLGYPELELQRIENDQSKINSFYDFYLTLSLDIKSFNEVFSSFSFSTIALCFFTIVRVSSAYAFLSASKFLYFL